MHRYQTFCAVALYGFLVLVARWVSEQGRNSFVIVISARTLMPRDCLETFSHFVLLYLLMAQSRGATPSTEIPLNFSLLHSSRVMSFFQSDELMMMMMVNSQCWRRYWAMQDKDDRTAKGSFVARDNLSKCWRISQRVARFFFFVETLAALTFHGESVN